MGSGKQEQRKKVRRRMYDRTLIFLSFLPLLHFFAEGGTVGVIGGFNERST